MGGMAAFIPSRTDAAANERAFDRVRADKQRESSDGHDGTWVAHPDLVPLAQEVFDAVLGARPNQIAKQRDDVSVTAEDLLDIRAPGDVTLHGVRTNVDVAIRYLASWLSGVGAAAIYNLMEDAATAEISRSQIWQWVHHGSVTADGTKVTPSLVTSIADEELARVRDEIGPDAYRQWRFDEAAEVFEQVALAADFPEFLTLPAYDLL